jgi:RNA polymerase I specific initiation factor
MSPASYFSLPLHASQQPLSLRAARYRRPRKRKRDEREEGDSSSTTDDELPSSNAATTSAEIGSEPLSGFTPVTQRSLAALATPIDARQYQTAGQPPQKPLPDSPFPHRAASPQDELGLGRGKTTRICQEELANLSPPLFVPISSYTVASAAAPEQRTKLRQRHLSVLTTIFHRCVLDGDFLRAERAWGMILRAEFGGKGVHLRREGRWGIGAEILLRRDNETSMSDGASEREDREESNHHLKQDMGFRFTRQGFEKAKEYYERLILQYQFRKWVPHSTGGLDFYPAMFSTWIYIVQAECKAGQNGSRERLESSLLHDDGSPVSESARSPDRQDILHEKHAGELESLRKKTLKEAEEIAARMDELMLSPPYSDSPQLWSLRGMVSLWISDLCMTPFPIVGGTIHDSSTGQDIDETVENNTSRGAHEQNQQRNDEIRKAKAAFGKANRVGASIGEGYMPILEDLNNHSDAVGDMSD